MKDPSILWLAEPEPHDYPAAASYLALHFGINQASDMAKRLALAPLVSFKAKDIFRASGLSLLGVSNSHVKKDRKKIKRGEHLSPLLLVCRQDRVIVADGYHRLCAVYQFNEDAMIPCKVI